jgi:LPS export ABC transporter permease LptF
MRFPRTLSWYVLREVLIYASLAVLAVGGVLVLQNALRHIQNLAGMGLTSGDALQLLTILGARFSTYAVPIAFLFGVMVAMGRLSSDSEIAAMQSLGVSFGQIVAPVVIVSIGVAMATSWLLHEAEPGARRDLRGLLAQVAARGGIIRAGTFNELDRSGHRLLYVDDRKDSKLEGVLIFDRTDDAKPYTVVAKTGEFEFEQETLTGHLRLHDGDIHFERELDDQKYQRIAFGVFDYAFDMDALVGVTFDRLQPQDMDTPQLREVLAHFDATGVAPENARVKERARYELQYQWRLALPFAPILFALAGAPLGVRRARGARSYGVLTCVILVFGYYLMLSVFGELAESGSIPATIALWIPTLLLAIAAGWLLYRAPRAGA